MTWVDAALILVIVVSLSMGAKLGSLWTGACLGGGFLGAFLVDLYSLPLSSMMGGFPGSIPISAVLLFLVGCAMMLVPGWLLSRISAGLFLGVVDSAFGLLTGGLAGLCAITLCLLLIVPLVPRVEKTRSWKRSFLVRPLHQFLESAVSRPHFRIPATTEELQRRAMKKLKPAAHQAGKEIKDTATRVIDKLKKD